MKSMANTKINEFLSLALYDKANVVRQLFYRVKGAILYRFVFASFGARSVLYPPLLLVRPDRISIGSNTLIRAGARLEAVCQPGKAEPFLTIGDNVNIEQSVHIICHNRVTIGSNVSITAFCSIVDVTHPVDGLPPSAKLGSQVTESSSSVEIGDGAFIGMGARILPGVRIGRGAVIGANAVVVHDVPDYHIAAGVPATVRRARQLAEEPSQTNEPRHYRAEAE